MCYHSIRNPCGECGCPSNTVPKSARLNPTTSSSSSTTAGRHLARTAFTDEQAALSFFSPSSDYYSLSPDSPPLSGATTAASNNSSPEPDPSAGAGGAVAAATTQMPIYAHVHKERSVGASSPAAARGLSPVDENPDLPRSSVSPSSPCSAGVKPVSSRGPPPPTARKPSLPLRAATEESKRAPGGGESTQDKSSNSRRHSWAGERKSAGERLSGKPTSLQEFKRLLAQQTPGQNPHRVSAQELLKTAESGAASPLKFSGGGSLRKKTSPWRDNRFSVIQEEAEMDRSRENLFD